MDKLSCLTCQINLLSLNDQREHYKSEWHLYNLKRKLNQLKSITIDEFNEIKIKHTNNDNNNNNDKTNLNELKFYCNVCGKNFFNQKSFEQHNTSNKHNRQIVNAAKLLNQYNNQKNKQNEELIKKEIINDDNDNDNDEEFNESDWEEIDDDDDDEIIETIPNDECLFCNYHSKTIELNLSHMAKEHSFFIPDLEYCIDLNGLLNYLGKKIASGHCCLWCSDNGKTFLTKKSTQQHMIDVGHTKINFYNRNESLLEFEDFYDYSSSYPKDSNDDDDEIDDLNILDNDNYQLKLPSGAIIGHRSLMIYYRQKLCPQKKQLIPSSTTATTTELKNKIQNHYRMIGFNNQNDNNNNSMINNKNFLRDIKYMNRLKYRMNLKLGQKSNQTKQKYFRCQIGFK